ncbi:MAG: hypothetical protein JWR84_1854 [Caulobacter sp.]|nr:hypothetical protein [Caulobacter sp.]
MKPLPLALGAATLAAFAAIVGFAVYSEVVQYMPLLFLYATDWTTKVAVLLLLAVLGLATLLPNRSGQASRRLNIMATLATGLGLLVTLLAVNNRGLYCGTETNFLKVWGPELAQGLMPLALGLLAATVATARAGKRPARA